MAVTSLTGIGPVTVREPPVFIPPAPAVTERSFDDFMKNMLKAAPPEEERRQTPARSSADKQPFAPSIADRRKATSISQKQTKPRKSAVATREKSPGASDDTTDTQHTATSRTSRQDSAEVEDQAKEAFGAGERQAGNEQADAEASTAVTAGEEATAETPDTEATSTSATATEPPAASAVEATAAEIASQETVAVGTLTQPIPVDVSSDAGLTPPPTEWELPVAHTTTESQPGPVVQMAEAPVAETVTPTPDAEASQDTAKMEAEASASEASGEQPATQVLEGARPAASESLPSTAPTNTEDPSTVKPAMVESAPDTALPGPISSAITTDKPPVSKLAAPEASEADVVELSAPTESEAPTASVEEAMLEEEPTPTVSEDSDLVEAEPTATPSSEMTFKPIRPTANPAPKTDAPAEAEVSDEAEAVAASMPAFAPTAPSKVKPAQDRSDDTASSTAEEAGDLAETVESGTETVTRWDTTAHGETGEEGGEEQSEAGREAALRMATGAPANTVRDPATPFAVPLQQARGAAPAVLSAADMASPLPPPGLEQQLEKVERLQELVERFDRHMLSLATGKDKTMSITLDPKELGKVILHCRESGDRMAVEIVAETSTVRQLLQQQEAPVRQMLEEHGYKMGSFDVRSQDNGGDASTFARRRSRQDGNAETQDGVSWRGDVTGSPPDAGSAMTHAPRGAGGLWVVA